MSFIYQNRRKSALFLFPFVIGDMECITLGDYGRLNNIDEVAQGFQLVNPLHFDIKYSVLSALRENQFLGREFEDCNAYLTHFL